MSSTSSAAARPRAPFGHVVALAAITAVALALRLWRLSAQSLWLDEVASALDVHALNEGGIRQLGQTDHVAPAVFFLQWLTTHVMGESAASLRLPSVIAGTLAVPMTWLVGRRIGLTSASSLVAAAFMAISPLSVWYSQEARAYAPWMFLGLVYVWIIWPLSEGRWSQLRVWLSALIAALGLWMFQYMALLMVCCGLWLLWSRIGWRRIVVWGISQAVAAASFLPWIYLSWGQSQNGSGFEKPAPAIWLPYTFYTYLAGSTLGPSVNDLRLQKAAAATHQLGAVSLVAVTALVLLIAALPPLWRRRRRASGWLLLWLLGPVAMAVVLGAGTSIGFNIRYTLVSLPAFALLVGGLTECRWRWLAWAAALLTCAVSVWSLVNWYSNPHYGKDDGRDAAAWLNAHTAPGQEVVITNPLANQVMRYFGWNCQKASVAHDPTVARAVSDALTRATPGTTPTYVVVYRPWEMGVDVPGELTASGHQPQLVASWPGYQVWSTQQSFTPGQAGTQVCPLR